MGPFLICYGLKNNEEEHRTFFNTIEGMGNVCPIADGTFLIQSDFGVEEIVDGLSEALDENDVLLIINLETLEIDGLNLPDCIEDYLSSSDEFIPLEFTPE